MDLYDELEESVKNNPARFSEMEFVADSINRLDELDKDTANEHRKIIFGLIFHHYQTRDITCKNNTKLPYGIEFFNRKKNSSNRSTVSVSKEESVSGSHSGIRSNSKSDSKSIGSPILDIDDPESQIETIKCVLEKIPPTLQKILLAYVKFYIIEE